MRLKPFLLFLATGLWTYGAAVAASTNSVPSANATNELTLAAFLNEVALANLNYAAQRYNVPIAQAVRDAAKVFPNPVLNLGTGGDVTHHGSERLPSTLGGGVTQTFELGGKRKARIQVADRNLRATAANLESYLHNLRADAAAAFVDAIATRQALEQKRRSASALQELVAANEQRLRVGDVGEVDVTQSRVELLQVRSELLASESDAQAAQIALAGFLGPTRTQSTLVPLGKLEATPRHFDQAQLWAAARTNRADLAALRHTRDGAQASLKLTRAGRVPDVDVGVGVIHSTSSENSIAPAPTFDSLGMTFSLPLPLFNRRTAEIRAAQLTFEQSEAILRAAEQKAEIDLRQALARYQLAVERVARFQSATLADAQKVLEAKRFSYQRGQTTLLDLLAAQRSANEVSLSYYDALGDAAKALIELERAAQVWDVDF